MQLKFYHIQMQQNIENNYENKITISTNIVLLCVDNEGTAKRMDAR